MARILALLVSIALAGWLADAATAQILMPAPQPTAEQPAIPTPTNPAPATPAPASPAPVVVLPGTTTSDTPPPLPDAPPPLPTEAADWFYGSGGQALGPFTISRLKQLAAQGEVTEDTPVWKKGMDKWVRLGEVAELASVLAAIPKVEGQPPPPPDSQALLNEAARKYLLGTWRYDGPVTQGGITAFVKIEITYRPDGSYAGTQTIQMPSMSGVQPPPQTIGRSGRYTITAIDKQQFVLTMSEYGGAPSQISLRVIDQNTVEDTANLLRSVRVR